MTEFLELKLPVGAQVGHEDEEHFVACLVDLRIPIVDAEAAPMVGSWHYDMAAKTDEYRAYGGRLLGCGYDRRLRLSLKSVVDVDWRQADEDAWRRLGWDPFLAWGGEFSAQASELVEYPETFPELARNVALAQERAAASAIIDDYVWLPTEGPRMWADLSGSRDIRIRAEPACYRGEFREDTHAAWSIFDRDALRDDLEATGLFSSIWVDKGVAVKTWDGWGHERILTASDERVLDVLERTCAGWRSDLSTKQMSAEMLAAVVEVRPDNEKQDRGERLVALRRMLDLAKMEWGSSAAMRRTATILEIHVSRIEERLLGAEPQLKGFSL